MSEGDAVMLQTPRGQARVRVHLEDGIMPGVVALPRGLGHTAYDGYIANKGINVNRLIGPGSGSCFRSGCRLGNQGQTE